MEAASLNAAVEARSRTRVPGVMGVAPTAGDSANVNTGNALHASAAWRIIGEGSTLPTARLWTPAELERIEAENSHIVVVLANALRLGHRGSNTESLHVTMYHNIARTQLPVVVFGLGAQAPDETALENLVVPEYTKRLMHLLSDRSVEIAVRGSFTQSVLEQLGISNATVLGCQSAFWHLSPEVGPVLPRRPSLDNVVFNYTGPGREWRILSHGVRNGYALIGQENVPERKALEGDLGPLSGRPWEFVFRRGGLTLEQYVEYLRAHFSQYYGVEEWLEGLKPFTFSFGSRFHGNMMALLAGVPAVWITHDTRTRELCDYHGLPSVDLEEIGDEFRVESVLEACDYGEFARKYPENLERLISYLDRAGLEHRLQAPASTPAPAAEPAPAPAAEPAPAVVRIEPAARPPAAPRTEAAASASVVQKQTNTQYDRYPNFFRFASEESARRHQAPRTILSFGCSDGSEAMTLADLYFTSPDDFIVGSDVEPTKLAEAVAANRHPDRVAFLDSRFGGFDFSDRFDAVFVMSVLCAWPETRDLEDCSAHLTFDRFGAVVADLDRMLRVGGLLTVFNANFRFTDLELAERYRALPTPEAWGSGFVKKFDRDNRSLGADHAYPHVVFEKLRPA